MSGADGRSGGAAGLIEAGKAVLGIEFGSTRIKGALIGPDGKVVASGSYGWENQLADGIWTYGLDEIWKGLAGCYSSLASDVGAKYGVELSRLAGMGISGMMHGYMASDAAGKLLVPFRTWRNNITSKACAELSPAFGFAIPQRWTIAHLYQSILDGQEHVSRIAHLTTLAGFVHWKLTGRKAVGVGEGSGILPIDSATGTYDAAMVREFEALAAGRKLGWRLLDILPEVLPAGAPAGTLTEAGARLLDPSGKLRPGVPFCPPEGDAGTGMVATNSVRPRSGNVSAGTSVFAMIVLEKKLKRVHEEIDMVVTPDGSPVAMAHANNGSSDFDAWIGLFGQAAEALGLKADLGDLYSKLTPLALEGDPDAGKLLAINFVSGEHVAGLSEGRPLFARSADSSFTIANFIRALLFSSLCAVRTGMDILTEEEGVAIEGIRGHGGFFKRGDTGQRLMAAALDTPVSLPAGAGEGGAWGMALLAAYMLREKKSQSLPEWLDSMIADSIGAPVAPDPRDVAGFREFFARYKAGLAVEKAAIAALK
jgi:sugar (pentulose or hexulose) kinase